MEEIRCVFRLRNVYRCSKNQRIKVALAFYKRLINQPFSIIAFFFLILDTMSVVGKECVQ